MIDRFDVILFAGRITGHLKNILGKAKIKEKTKFKTQKAKLYFLTFYF
jgi:hypothetical protein